MAFKDKVILSHRRDFDGIASAAELFRLFRGSVERAIFTNPNKGLMLGALSELKGMRNMELYITDLSLSEDGMLEICNSIDEIRRNKNKIFWLDHHPWPEGAIQLARASTEMLIAGENKDYCAAELVYTNLVKDDAVSKRIAELAHLTDFNIRPNDSALDGQLIKISKCIAFLDESDRRSNELRERLMLRVSEGEISGEVIDEVYAIYKESEEKNLSQLKETMDSFSVGNIRIGIAFAENLQSNMACSVIKEATGANVQVFVTTKDWAAHVRSDSGIDSSILSKAFGGNGHAQASGFTLNPTSKELGEAIKWYKNTVKDSAMRAFAR